MYCFIATYYDVDADAETKREIKFDGQFLESEKECYMHAMHIAYDGTKSNECFISLELLYC